MQGLAIRAIQGFVTDTYGADVWREVAQAAGLERQAFEAMLGHDPALTRRVMAAAAGVLGRPAPEVLEDIGTYLVSHPHLEALRRLLRFGGEGFVDFLHSLDDLRDRARLAVSDLELPALELHDHAADSYSLWCRTSGAERPDWLPEGFGHVMLGVLRAMADDYGALVLLDHHGAEEGGEVIGITLVEPAFAEGRRFDLGRRAG